MGDQFRRTGDRPETAEGFQGPRRRQDVRRTRPARQGAQGELHPRPCPLRRRPDPFGGFRRRRRPAASVRERRRRHRFAPGDPPGFRRWRRPRHGLDRRPRAPRRPAAAAGRRRRRHRSGARFGVRFAGVRGLRGRNDAGAGAPGRPRPRQAAARPPGGAVRAHPGRYDGKLGPGWRKRRCMSPSNPGKESLSRRATTSSWSPSAAPPTRTA